MNAYIEEQVSQGGYSTVSEYFRELIRQDQKRKATESLEIMLLESLDSGTATPITDQDWEDIRQSVRNRLSQQIKSSEG
jgi:antitoxin ParD1/3/4